jgi:deoxyribonuclease V
MKIRRLHPWDLTAREARHLQERLRVRVVPRGSPSPVRRVAGADVSYDRGADVLFAAMVILDAQSLEVLEVARARVSSRFPYVPGLLSFREAPPVLAAAARLSRPPDLLLCDGQGMAHPRRFGLACHLGLILDLPTFGCAKTRLLGEHREPEPERGAFTRLVDRGETVGSVVRTRTGVKPLYVSAGHRIGLRAARRFTLSFCRKYRLPEPLRMAHRESNRARRGEAPAGQETRPC